jgi:hypothetical protein
MAASNQVRATLVHVQALNDASPNANKHQQIRVTHRVRKLLSQPMSNPAWLKNIGEHAAVLLSMLQDGVRITVYRCFGNRFTGAYLHFLDASCVATRRAVHEATAPRFPAATSSAQGAESQYTVPTIYRPNY